MNSKLASIGVVYGNRIYDINDREFKESLFELTSDDFKSIEIVLAGFKKLTGLTIDQYGTTRLHYDHVKLIIKLIDDYLMKNTTIEHGLGEKLSKIKGHFIKIANDVIAVGD